MAEATSSDLIDNASMMIIHPTAPVALLVVLQLAQVHSDQAAQPCRPYWREIRNAAGLR